VVYERDLGKKTAEIAGAMKEYDPSSRWLEADEPPQETAGKKPN